MPSQPMSHRCVRDAEEPTNEIWVASGRMTINNAATTPALCQVSIATQYCETRQPISSIKATSAMCSSSMVNPITDSAINACARSGSVAVASTSCVLTVPTTSFDDLSPLD